MMNIFSYRLAAGWYIGAIHANCDTTCQSHNLKCTEAELLKHNSDVDSSEKLMSLIRRLYGDVSFSSCQGNYGTAADVPVFTTSHSYHFCLHSSSGRSLSTFDCKRSTAENHQSKQRLCYCH